MKLVWHQQAWDDYLNWQITNKIKLKRINELIKSVTRTPFEGIGNPEPLKHGLQGYWSRRIDSEHRLVYTIQDEDLIIISCKFHY